MLDSNICGCKHDLNRRRAGCMRVIDRRFMLPYFVQSIRVTVSFVTVNVVCRRSDLSDAVRLGRDLSIRVRIHFWCDWRRGKSCWLMKKEIHHRLPLPVGLDGLGVAIGGMRIPIEAGLPTIALCSSMRPLARLIPGTTHSPQLQRMPCHAYLPMLVLHLGHSRRPSSLPCSSSGRIHDNGSRK